MDLQGAFDRVNESLFLPDDRRDTVLAEPAPFSSTHYTYEHDRRKHRLHVKVHDILLHAPEEIVEGVASMILGQHYKVPYRPSHWQKYLAWRQRPEVLSIAQRAFLARDRMITGSPRGRAYDLGEIFADVNMIYFGGAIPAPVLVWTKRESRRTFGTYLDDLYAIVVNRILDDVRIPQFVLESVLHHELLHINVDTLELLGRTIHHSPTFKHEEKRYIRQEEAEKWIARIALGKVGGMKR